MSPGPQPYESTVKEVHLERKAYLGSWLRRFSPESFESVLQSILVENDDIWLLCCVHGGWAGKEGEREVSENVLEATGYRPLGPSPFS